MNGKDNFSLLNNHQVHVHCSPIDFEFMHEIKAFYWKLRSNSGFGLVKKSAMYGRTSIIQDTYAEESHLTDVKAA